MVVTREIREEIKNSVSTSITSLLKEYALISRIVEKVTDSVIKTIQGRLSQLEEKVETLSTYSPVIKDLRNEVSALKSDNEYLLKKLDELDQDRRSNNLMIFKVPEKERNI
nr:unnamed protein product [Callosobruchus analis]